MFLVHFKTLSNRASIDQLFLTAKPDDRGMKNKLLQVFQLFCNVEIGRCTPRLLI